MYDWQNSRCAVCGRSLRDGVVDHDHSTGWVRGFLCRSCNLREGHATPGDDHPITRRLLRYRRWYPAKILGVWERYDHPLRGDDYGWLAGRATTRPYPVSPQGVVLIEDWPYSLANSPVFKVAAAFEEAARRHRSRSAL
jgi:hypothetical protein